METTTTAGARTPGSTTDVPPGRRRRRDVLKWTDRVHGPTEIHDRAVLDLIGCPTFQRLRGVRQAGPSALAFPFKNVTRYEHSLGVFVLLRRLGASLDEQVAGLLHDVSHTAFSHAIDFVITSDEQAHHEEIKHLFLERPDMVAALAALGHAPGDFLDDSAHPLLERPIPWLCADRVDYFLRDSLACGVTSQEQVDRFLDALVVVDDTIAFRDVATAREVQRLFAIMNRDWWASDTEAYIYNEFGQLLRQAIGEGVIDFDDLLTEDDLVLEKLRSAGSADLISRLARIEQFDPDRLIGYQPAITPKKRWLDPPVVVRGQLEVLGSLEPSAMPS